MDENATGPELSAVVLGYQAAEGLVPILDEIYTELESASVSFEVVVVANYHAGQVDATPAVAESFAREHPDVRVVARPKEGGMGWDMRTGMDAARGRVIVVVDGDGQYAARDVVRAYRELVESGADIAKGRRISRADGLYRRAITTVYNVAFLLLFPMRRVWDINGKPKAITGAAWRRLETRSTDWFLDAEIVLAARKAGLRIVDFPVVYTKGAPRPSFVRPGAILEFAIHLLRYRVLGRP